MSLYKESCKQIGIEAPKEPGFYLGLDAIDNSQKIFGKRDGKFIFYMYDKLTQQVDLLDDYIIHKASPKMSYEQALDVLQATGLYRKNLERLAMIDCDISSPVSRRIRDISAMAQTIIENPRRSTFIQAIGATEDEEGWKALLRRIKDTATEHAETLGISNWIFADRCANVVYEGENFEA